MFHGNVFACDGLLAFQTQPHLPPRTNDFFGSVSIRAVGARRPPCALGSGQTGTHDSVRVEFESTPGGARLEFSTRHEFISPTGFSRSGVLRPPPAGLDLRTVA